LGRRRGTKTRILRPSGLKGVDQHGEQTISQSEKTKQGKEGKREKKNELGGKEGGELSTLKKSQGHTKWSSHSFAKWEPLRNEANKNE